MDDTQASYQDELSKKKVQKEESATEHNQNEGETEVTTMNNEQCDCPTTQNTDINNKQTENQQIYDHLNSTNHNSKRTSKTKHSSEGDSDLNEHIQLDEDRLRKSSSRSNEIGELSRTNSRKSTDSSERCILTDEEEQKLQRQVRIIFFILNIMGFLASFSYWMQSGVLPYLTRKLGVYSEVFGYMQSTYAFYQMIGSPIFGRCGDVFGCRAVMVVSELSAMLTYGMLSFASNVFMLFMSRVPALSQHNLQGSYMIITDISLPEQRAKMLGILGVSHGMGKILFLWLVLFVSLRKFVLLHIT